MIYTVIKSKKAMHMLQQNLYNDGNRYLKWIRKNPRSAFLGIDVPAFLCLIGNDVFKLNILIYIAIVIYIIGVFIVCRSNKKEKTQMKKPLVVTARVKRLIVTATMVYLIPVVCCYFFKEQTNLLLVILATITYLVYFYLWCINILNKPIEKCVYHIFYFQATSKLKSMKRLKVIGITGSYGKTSSKNILSDILNVKMIARPTLRNLNTEYGLMMSINNHLDKFDEVFIAETGAYKRGEIKKLCNMVHPSYGILTTIGTAHLESFGNEENIQKAKFELIESLPKNGIGILNGDDPKQVSYQLKNTCRIVWIGIDNRDVDVYADNIKCSSNGSTFDCHFKGDAKAYSFETKLLGNHNIYNILASIALAKELGMTVSEIQTGVHKVRPVKHRLEMKEIGNIHMIDDAYNSNPVGAKKALEVLKMMPGTKVVVTPGMIELGEKEDEYNKTFGTEIAEVADYVILIGEKKTKAIYEGLLEKKYDKDKIYILNDVKESFKLVESFKGKEDIFALYENDLPDSYNEKK